MQLSKLVQFPCLLAQDLLQQSIAKRYHCLLVHTSQLAGPQSLQKLPRKLGKKDQREVHQCCCKQPISPLSHLHFSNMDIVPYNLLQILQNSGEDPDVIRLKDALEAVRHHFDLTVRNTLRKEVEIQLSQDGSLSPVEILMSKGLPLLVKELHDHLWRSFILGGTDSIILLANSSDTSNTNCKGSAFGLLLRNLQAIDIPSCIAPFPTFNLSQTTSRYSTNSAGSANVDTEQPAFVIMTISLGWYFAWGCLDA